ncbi:hypothetical protein KAI78_08220 [bacterium]|nr:hypothetical protein [bacterium]
MNDKSIKKYERDDSTENLLQETVAGIVAGITGLTSSKKGDLILSFGRILQSTLSGKFLYSLIEEWKKFKEKGKINEEYEKTTQHKECLSELLDALDKDIYDELKISTLKKIFILAATEEHSTRDDILPQQYLKICRKLSSGELLVLFAEYKMIEHCTSIGDHGLSAANLWLSKISEFSGLGCTELVENYEDVLINLRLIKKRRHDDRSGISYSLKQGRLTNLGFEIVEYIRRYEAVIE